MTTTDTTIIKPKDRWASGVTPYAEMGYYDADYERIGTLTGQAVQWVVPRGSVA